MAQCNAKAKRTGERCRAPAMPNGKCRVHGGASLKGVASPSFKHGHRSKYLPERMHADALATITDPEILNLTSEIAVKDARIADLMRRADSGESGMMWKQLRETWNDFLDAQRARDTDGVARLIQEVGTLITRGNNDAAIWREIAFEIDQRRKLVEAERKRRMDMQTMIPAERAAILFRALSDAVVRRVEDVRVRNQILDEFRKLAGS